MHIPAPGLGAAYWAALPRTALKRDRAGTRRVGRGRRIDIMVHGSSFMNPLPTDREGWLIEIGRALRDASEAIPFGPLAGASFGAAELFHLGPVTALKFRGIRQSKRVVRKITEAALASYIATASEGSGSLTDSRVAFAFTYLTSHFALDLLNEQQVAELMDFIESHPDALS